MTQLYELREATKQLHTLTCTDPTWIKEIEYAQSCLRHLLLRHKSGKSFSAVGKLRHSIIYNQDIQGRRIYGNKEFLFAITLYYIPFFNTS
jgi:hypothetical protein